MRSEAWDRRRRRLRVPSSAARRGAAAVEMALVAPIVFVFVFGAIEFGRFNIVRHAANNAAYEAARHGMVPGATAGEMEAHAQQHLSAVSVTGATVQVTPRVVEEETELITVQVTVPTDQNSWVVPSFLTGAQIQSSCSLRTERYRD